MRLWSRAMFILKLRSRAMFERAENPVQVLGYVDEQQQELLRRVKQGLIEVAISKRQLQQQVSALDARVPKMDDQARRALAAGREDLARLSLERKVTALAELENLEAQIVEVDHEEQRLALAEQQLAARIEQFRVHRQTVSARYTAAEAQVKVKEALSGVSTDFADLGMALGRAEEKIDRMLARATAVDAVIDMSPGSVPPYRRDVVESELRELAQRETVEEEMANLKAELERDASWVEHPEVK